MAAEVTERARSAVATAQEEQTEETATDTATTNEQDNAAEGERNAKMLNI